MNNALLREPIASTGVSQFPIEGLSWKYTQVILRACSANDICSIAIGQ